MSKTLVAYFSATGSTARLAKTLAEATGGELFEIQPKQQYTSAELNWNDKNSRSTKEMNDKSCRPEIADKVQNMEQYTTIFVGFPIWWYEAPRIIQTFLESYDFSGKTVIPFATSGGSSMGETNSILMQSCSQDTQWKKGKRMNANTDVETLKDWVDQLGL